MLGPDTRRLTGLHSPRRRRVVALATSITWQRSSYSAGSEGNTCVEVGTSANRIHLRESDTPNAIITTNRMHLSAFIRRIKAGR
ncbi:DUF397 domain-containing protein [Streptomyces silvisoli]|uniref:DUF397 domain-containing protein n=1 Tax=Streptomyces silvisoli TaxID=3034235 RepID=A0ABT5ZH17_9ACTN|nr:DUF397 domain-containing protein [Streptomyces silvisoli]MDF3289108.1 DUF397 domain-containing protein [Streptomyces silvisoli]